MTEFQPDPSAAIARLRSEAAVDGMPTGQLVLDVLAVCDAYEEVNAVRGFMSALMRDLGIDGNALMAAVDRSRSSATADEDPDVREMRKCRQEGLCGVLIEDHSICIRPAFDGHRHLDPPSAGGPVVDGTSDDVEDGTASQAGAGGTGAEAKPTGAPEGAATKRPVVATPPALPSSPDATEVICRCGCPRSKHRVRVGDDARGCYNHLDCNEFSAPDVDDETPHAAAISELNGLSPTELSDAFDLLPAEHRGRWARALRMDWYGAFLNLLHGAAQVHELVPKGDIRGNNYHAAIDYANRLLEGDADPPAFTATSASATPEPAAVAELVKAVAVAGALLGVEHRVIDPHNQVGCVTCEARWKLRELVEKHGPMDDGTTVGDWLRSADADSAEGRD